MNKTILYIITQSEFGGAQHYVFDLAQNLNQNHNIHLAVGTPGTQNWITSLAKENIKIWRLKHLQRNIHPYHNTASIFELYKLIKKIKPDVVHLNSSMSGFVGALAAKLAGVPKTIYTVHGLVLNEKINPFLKTLFWLFEFLGKKMTNHIICVSEFDKQSVLKFCLAPKNKITVVHNGLDLNNQNFLDKQTARAKLTTDLPLPAENKLIGFIGYFYKNKGLKHLIKAAALLKQEINDISFILIGKGNQEKNLRQLIQKNNLNQDVFLIGEIVNAKQYLKAFDIFVLPSLKEGLSITLLEATAAGLPIVATKVGGNSEIVEHQKNGLLIPAANPFAIKKSIQQLLTNNDLATNLSYNTQNKIKQFSLEQMINKTKLLYQ